MQKELMNGLDLFSGIGGISEGLKQWVKPVVYCERDRYVQAVLLSRMASNDIERAPIWDDITSLRGSMLPAIDIIYGGFPCQDISHAGNRVGLEVKRSGLFFEIVRLAKEINPPFIFLENVPGIRTRGLARVCFELATLGYDMRWTIISAASIGAPHQRDRWFILAHSNGMRKLQQTEKRNIVGNGSGHICDNVSNSNGVRVRDAKGCQRTTKAITKHDGKTEQVANTSSNRLEEKRVTVRHEKELTTTGFTGSASKWWDVEPPVGRVVNGLPFRMDRIKCLGNSVVPEQVTEAFKKLIAFNN